MRALYSALLGLAMAGCAGDGDVELRAIIAGEQYSPATHGCDARESKYVLILDTEYGRKAVEVLSTENSEKETLDSLLSKECRIALKVNKDNLNMASFRVKADGINLLK